MDKENVFGRLIQEVNTKFTRLYAALLERYGLTLPQYALLNNLYGVAPMTMTEASRELHISKPAVTHLVDRLEDAKMIKRIAHESDRRAYLLEIQVRGERTVSEIRAVVVDEMLLKAVQSFKREEKHIVQQFFKKISEKLDARITDLTPKSKL